MFRCAGHLLICEPIMNSGRLRQVVGRLTRIGQLAQQVSVQLFFVENTIEHRILRLRPPVGLSDNRSSSAAEETTLFYQGLPPQVSQQNQTNEFTADNALSILGVSSEELR